MQNAVFYGNIFAVQNIGLTVATLKLSHKLIERGMRGIGGRFDFDGTDLIAVGDKKVYFEIVFSVFVVVTGIKV